MSIPVARDFAEDGYTEGLLYAPHEEAVAAGERLYAAMPKDRPIAIVCLGSPTIQLDSFGPRVGSFLECAKLPADVVCFGSLDDPVGLPMKDNPNTDAAIRGEAPQGAWVLIVDAGSGRRGDIRVGGPAKPPNRFAAALVNRIFLAREGVTWLWAYNKSRRIGDASMILGLWPTALEDYEVPIKALRAATAILYALRKRATETPSLRPV